MWILTPGKETVPVLLMIMAIGSQVHPNILNLPFSLAIGLRVITRGETDGDVEVLEKSLPDPGDKLGCPVRHNIYWQTVVAKLS